jgi:alanine racemase
MQRFGCPPELLDDLVPLCDVEDFFSHSITAEAAHRLRDACAGRGRPMHAAATSLLDQPDTWFDAVRPGVALYRGAVRVSTRLSAVHDTTGPIGYTGFTWPRIGIILAGYSNFVRAGPVLVNGRLQKLLEVGMNTSYVSVDPADSPGDEVVLLGDSLTEATLAGHFGTREHEILCRYCAMGPRRYLTQTPGASAPASAVRGSSFGPPCPT